MNQLLMALALVSANVNGEFREQCLRPTVGVFQSDGHCIGSGFIIESQEQGPEHFLNTVITANHLFGSPDEQFKITVRTLDYDDEANVTGFHSHEATLFKFNEDLDVAVLVFRTKTKLPTVILDDDPPKVGDEITHIGCGLGQLPRFDDGQITQVGPSIRTNMFVTFGDSGGPVFRNNKLIGIVQKMSSVSNGHISFFVPLKDIRKVR
jgi:S1-C subfamily serine protease